tara:strand:+ start:520 stop:861 length:342 start_codon:yes stop_codon:yes gene_type:complete
VNRKGWHWLAARATFIYFLIMVMNVCDAILTHSWLELGVIEEANPLMAYLLETSPPLFFTVKLTLVYLGGFLLWRHRYTMAAQLALLGLTAVYAWVMWLHYDVWRLVERYGSL